MPTPFPDPFRNEDEKWETYELTNEEEVFSQPDLKSRDLNDFLRSLEPRIPRPVSTPNGGRAIGHIQGFPS